MNNTLESASADKLALRFLEIANRHSAMQPLLEEFVVALKQVTACHAVGIRILQEDGGIPYRAFDGFDNEFYAGENLLCLNSDQCMCAHVLKGRVEPAATLAPGGSFFTSHVSGYLSNLSADERQRIRGLCHQYGYESVALVPVRLGEHTLGLIHVADRRAHRIQAEMVGNLEHVAMQLGAAMQRIKMEEALRQSHEKLEEQVRDRTAQLTRINSQLCKAIDQHKRTESALKLNEARLEALYQLSQMDGSSLQEICDFVVEQAGVLTRSQYGYLFFMNEDETVLTVHAWSKKAMATCAVAGMPKVYLVEETGLWGEAVRQRRPIITNDYAAPNPLKRGIPEGHVALTRHMNIPVFEDERIVAVAGVANKRSAYEENDVRQLQLLMKGMWRHIQRQKAQETLRRSEQKLRFLTSELIQAQETERQRLSRELHDELGQSLLTLKLQIKGLQRRLTPDQGRMADDCKRIRAYLKELTGNVRRLSRDLRPAVLEDLGLLAALRWLFDEMGRHHKLDITYDIDRIHRQFGESEEILIFRVVQEALTNVVKHANATQVEIAFKKNKSQFQLTLSDNGRGFDVHQIQSRAGTDRGMGLATMDERVRMLGGTLRLQSNENCGTCIDILIPAPSKL